MLGAWLTSSALWFRLRIARRAGVGRPAVWRWQRRFVEGGVDGLLRDASRKPGKAPLADATVQRVVALTCAEPPGEATQWTGRAMAKATGISLRSVQRIWQAHKLQPHRIRTFKRSHDPAFAAKLEDIVGLCMDPPNSTNRAGDRYQCATNCARSPCPPAKSLILVGALGLEPRTR